MESADLGCRLVYSLAVSLDGYVVDADGGFEWSMPDQEVFDFATDEVRGVDVHLLGRRLYETMLYWETVDDDTDIEPEMREFAALWRALPKVVFSRTLGSVTGSNTRLATQGLAEEIAQLRARLPNGVIAIGGATLATEAAGLDLIDEYRLRVYPVLVGGGIPYFAHAGRRTNLELLQSRTFGSQVVQLRYRVQR